MSSENTQYTNLISELKNSLSTHLKECAAKMFIKIDESLFDMANKAGNSKDQNRYYELMRDTRSLKDSLTADFISNLSPYLRPFAEAEAKKKKVSQDDMEELSLVGQTEMDEMVLVKSMGGNIAGRFREPLSHLDARLEHLALQTPKIFSKNALQPTNIFQAFDDALGENFDISNKKLLFKFFNDHVAVELGKTYDAINNILIDAGILPQIKLHFNKSKASKRPNQPQPVAEQSAQDAESGQYDPEQNMNQGGYAMTAQPGHAQPGSSQGGAHGGGHSAGGQAANHPQETGTHGGGGTGAPASGGSAPNAQGGQQQGGGQASTTTGNTSDGSGSNSPATYQHSTAGMPASQVGEVVGGYLGGAPLAPPNPDTDSTDLTAGAQFFPATTGQHYGHQEILDALSNVQQNPIFSNAENAQYDAEAIKQAVLSEIAKTSGGAVTKRINRIAEKTIDFIELVFDAIIDDDNISDTIKTLLLRLQIPVIKASMIDQEFFIYDDHPARVLLDKIAHAGIGVSDRKDEIYHQLDRIVTALVNDFELQADSFKTALDHLNSFLDERDAVALEKEEESQKQILREHARSTVLKSLRLSTKGKILPESIHTLVLKRWPTLMYNHYLKQGKENDEWINIIDTLRAIINSVQPITNAHDLEHLFSSREHLIETTRSYLQITNESKEDVDQVIMDLIEIHQSCVQGATISDTVETESHTELSASEEASREEEKEVKLQLPSSIVPGAWFQIHTGEDKAQRRCKLSVVIPDDQKMVFVNYQGEVIIEKDLGDFLDEVADGRSKAIMGHSIFDHALSSVVHHLQQ